MSESMTTPVGDPTAPGSVPLVSSPEEITPEWLGAALGGPVDAVTLHPVGTGQIGTCFRVAVEGDDVAPRLLAKLPPADRATRDMLAGTYRGEVRFYREIAPTVDIRVPACHFGWASPDSGDFVLLLEDMAPAEQGDQIEGCTPEQAHDAVANLAGLHGPRWCDETLAEIEGLTLDDPDSVALLEEMSGPTTELFIDGLGDLLDDEDRATLRACVPVLPTWMKGRGGRFGLVHGDYRLDNLLFPPDGRPGVAAIDWQTLSLALPARDLAYFVGTGLSVDDRRAHERDLVGTYHRRLLSYGVEGYSFEECWDDYRFSMLQGPLVATFGCAYSTRTERGDRMFAAMARRSCAAIRDLGTLDLI